MVKAMDLLGLESLKNPVEPEDVPHWWQSEKSKPNMGDGPSDSVVDILANNAGSLPKFFINGKGETSGMNKWTKAIRQTRLL